MAYTPLASTDNWSTSRATINSNFSSVDTQLANKLEYSGTVPADWDLAVFSGVTGKVVKKKVFTASQVLESDSNGQPTSAAKGTGYNLNLGTTAGTVLEGSNDALYMKLAGTQTVTGDKTFSGVTRAVTQSQSDNSTNVATTAYVDAAAAIQWKNWTTTKNAADASTTQNIAHGLGKTPKYVRITAFCKWTNTSALDAPAISQTVYNWTTQSSASVYAVTATFTDLTSDNTFTLNVGGSSWTQTGVVTCDATNIIITWTKTNSPTGTYTLLWEVNW